MNKLILGNSLEELKGLKDNSIDSIVTDPPYELGFMGKKWDNTGIAYNVDLWAECLRVLKPGGHLLAFSGTRTYHRMAVAIEDAGFEVRDMIEWVYGSGFPKSLNIGKSVDKLQGNKRETYLAPIAYPDSDCWGIPNNNISGNNWGVVGANDNGKGKGQGKAGMTPRTKGTSEWEGWGTALKPAHEPICMARKPLAEKNVANNVLKWGTGGINIDESRVETSDSLDGGGTIDKSNYSTVTLTSKAVRGRTGVETGGRFPANLIHDNSDEVRECFPETKNGGQNYVGGNRNSMFGNSKVINPTTLAGDSGSASRFFKSIIYNPKASKAERNKGCEGLEEKQYSHDGRKKEIENAFQRNKSVATNNHPTVKPIALMEYLIKMVTPKGGTVLDPFMGSGSTGVAAKKNGYDFIGIDMTPEYIKIAKARINATEIENRLI